MDKICRFCLKVSIKNMCSLQECDILYNIQKFLTIEIPTEGSFPNNLCKDCFKKISQIIKFCVTVQENEDKLQQYSKNDQLQDYYSKITNNITQIEQQNNDEQKDLKIETYYLKVDYDIDTDIEDNDNLKSEELSNDINETDCSTDDEVTLSTIKKRQELKTRTSVIEPKKITKFRPIKSLNNNSKTRKVIEPEEIEYLDQFSCLSCLKACDSQTSLIKHYYDEHFKRKIQGKNYTEHKSKGKTTFSCDSCEQTYDLRNNIVRHVMNHIKERPLTCQLCARTYRNVSEIVRHARAHNGFKLKCPYECGFTSAYEGAIKEHTSRHLNEYKYTCEKCGKGFNTKTWFDQHQNIHTGKRPFVCNICGLTFPMARYLYTHKASTHPQSSSLKRYCCIRCSEKCDSAKSLAIHMEKHGIIKEADFLCDFCGKILQSSYQLRYHHRMHLGVKPYSCTICKKKFAKKYNVQLHMSIHSGERSHTCTHCGKQYTQRPTLLRHLKRYHPGASTKPKSGSQED